MSLSLQQMSVCIDNKEYSKVESSLCQFIREHAPGQLYLNITKEHIGQPFLSKQEQMNYTFCDAMANIIVRLFCAPGYYPSKEAVKIFLAGKHAVEMIFSSSIWKNTDTVIEHLQLIKMDKNGQTNLTEKQLALLLMLVTLGSKYRLPWGAFFNMAPENALTAYMGLITQRAPSLTKETNKGFNFLLESAKDLPFFELPVANDLSKLAFSFFNCSFATSPDKYEFKKWMTTLIRLNLEQWLDDDVKKYIADLPAFQRKKKPKLAVMLERFSNNHAMYRCFNTPLKTLAVDYELVAFIEQLEADKSDLSAFDKVVILEQPSDITATCKLVIQEQPDIIFYPSVGMQFWGIYLSQLRLAPLQMISAGHPSSSFSPEIDYCLLFGCSTPVEQLQPFFSEKVMMEDSPPEKVRFHVKPSLITDNFVSEHNHFLNDDDEMKIAINGVMTKVTADIVDVCNRIQKGTSKKLTFVFFSQHSSNQLAYLAAKKQLSRELKNFELICFSDYLTYMEAISQCHLLLPTLPFGGSNSNIDAMILNKPKLFIRGKAQIYTLADQWEWERVGLSEELGCDDEDELVSKSLHFIHDSQYRKKMHQLVDQKCSLKDLFPEHNVNNNLLRDVFVKAIDDVLNQ